LVVLASDLVCTLLPVAASGGELLFRLVHRLSAATSKEEMEAV
jgi:hypothetical protein